jgi:hypothetical protein
MNHHLLVIKTSSAHSPHFSTRLKNLSTLMHGSVLLSLSLHYYPHHVQKQIRHFLQHSSFAALPAFGGIIIMPCSQKDM